MKKKPLSLLISPLAISAREEQWLKEYGCTLGFQGNRCTITCPPGTLRKGLPSLKPDRHVSRYEIIFPNGTRIMQHCMHKCWLFGLRFGKYRTSELLIENTKA